MAHEGMVHALLEAHRVLKPDGLLIDLRPAAVHRRVGFAYEDGYQLKWTMRETFEKDRNADRAVADVVRQGRFKPLKTAGPARFPCYRVMDTLHEFQEWLTDFVQRGNLESHDWLVRRLEKALAAASDRPGIVVSAPLSLRVLRKRPPDVGSDSLLVY